MPASDATRLFTAERAVKSDFTVSTVTLGANVMSVLLYSLFTSSLTQIESASGYSIGVDT